MPFVISPEKLGLVVALSFFFGLAFEEYHTDDPVKPPGGVRTFPLLALAGTLLYALDPARALALSAGLAVLGAWLFAYYFWLWRPGADPSRRGPGLMSPVANALAFLLGPATLTQPHWVVVAITVGAVILLGAKEPLHAAARKIPREEILTLAKFLVLTAIILPLLPDHPVSGFTQITPYRLWLAVVVVSGLSYASYLATRYISPTRGVLLAAGLGGLYSSTATTISLAQRARTGTANLAALQAGIVLATALMNLRILAVVAVFSPRLALVLAPSLLALALFGFALPAWAGRRAVREANGTLQRMNPLELGAAAVFAGLFVLVSIVSTWVEHTYGHNGLFALAGLVGLTDIDPFVLSLAQGGVAGVGTAVAAAAVLIAASSNNLIKAGYAMAFAGPRAALRAAIPLALLAAAGLAAAAWLAP